MVDAEKVMKGLECCKECTNDDPFQRRDECPYNDISISVQDCRAVLSAEALELVKRYKAVPVRLESDARGIRFSCGNCDMPLWIQTDTASLEYNRKRFRFCNCCGQAVK